MYVSFSTFTALAFDGMVHVSCLTSNWILTSCKWHRVISGQIICRGCLSYPYILYRKRSLFLFRKLQVFFGECSMVSVPVLHGACVFWWMLHPLCSCFACCWCFLVNAPPSLFLFCMLQVFFWWMLHPLCSCFACCRCSFGECSTLSVPVLHGAGVFLVSALV